jgi:hypothetical protein
MLALFSKTILASEKTWKKQTLHYLSIVTARSHFQGDKKVISDTFLDGLQEVVVGLALVLEGEATVGNVVQVLEPLEVGDGDTASVDVQVGNDEHLLVAEDGVAGWRDRAVGSLGNDLGLLEKNSFIIYRILSKLNFAMIFG